MYPAYVSKYNTNCVKQVIHLIISNREKKLSALLRGITSKTNGIFYCMNYLHSFRTNNELESHQKVCVNKDFCNVIMSSEDTKLSEFN